MKWLIIEDEFTMAERDVLQQLADQQQLTRAQVLRQALRNYQLIATGHSKLVEVSPLEKARPFLPLPPANEQERQDVDG